MDPIINPFSPGAGSPPPELAGRGEILEHARILFERTKLGLSEKSILLTGLRGVGKTVLLNEMERIAKDLQLSTILIESHEEHSFGVSLVQELKGLLFEFDRVANIGDKAKRGLRVLKSFSSTIRVKFDQIELGLDLDPELGSADSGDIELDLPSVLTAVGEAAKACNKSVAIFIDEIQFISKIELSALIMTMHKMQQRQLPIALVGAGLPLLHALVGNSKSYAERLFYFPEIRNLSLIDATTAIREPLSKHNVALTTNAMNEIYKQSNGYPYFLQEWGYQLWKSFDSALLESKHVAIASTIVKVRLDSNFFQVRYNRLTPKEKIFLRTMAELGNGPYAIHDIVQLLCVSKKSIGPIRASLIKKGMIYSASHGFISFTVPLFNEFMIRTIPNIG